MWLVALVVFVRNRTRVGLCHWRLARQWMTGCAGAAVTMKTLDPIVSVAFVVGSRTAILRCGAGYVGLSERKETQGKDMLRAILAALGGRHW